MLKSEAAELLAIAGETYDREISPELVTIWAEVLSIYPVEELRQALKAHLREGSFFPKPADIVAQVRIARARHAEIHGIHPPPPPGKRWAVDVIENDPALGSAP